MSFGLGLAEGLATGLDTGLKKSMAEREERISTIAKLRAQSVIEESGKHATQFKSTKQAVRALAGMANNDMELVQYAVQEFGLDGAKDYITKLRKTSDDSGGVIKMASLVDLDRSNIPVSSAQIASTIVGPPTYLSDLEKSDSTRVRGFAGFFDDDIADNVNNRVNQYIDASALNQGYLKEMDNSELSPIASFGEKTWLINAPADAKERMEYYKKLIVHHNSIAANPTSSNDQRAINSLKTAIEIKSAWELDNIITRVDKTGDNLSPSETNSIRQKYIEQASSILQISTKVQVINGREYLIPSVEKEAAVVDEIASHYAETIARVKNAVNIDGAKIDPNVTSIADINRIFTESIQQGFIPIIKINEGDMFTRPFVEIEKTDYKQIDFKINKDNEATMFTLLYGSIKESLKNTTDDAGVPFGLNSRLPDFPEFDSSGFIINNKSNLTDIAIPPLTVSQIKLQTNTKYKSSADKKNFAQTLINDVIQGKAIHTDDNGVPLTPLQIKNLFSPSYKLQLD